MSGLLLLLGALYLWQATMRERERARMLAHELCAQSGVQLLDQTVSLAGLRLVRNEAGRLRPRLRYAFEVSLDGHDRHRSVLDLLDGRLLGFSLPSTTPPASAPAPAAMRGSNIIEFPRRPH